MNYSFIISLFFSAALFAQANTPFLSVDFENDAIGAYTNDMATKDFPPKKGMSSWYAMEQNGGQNSFIVENKTHGKTLRLKYPAGCLGPNDSPLACAAQLKLPLQTTAETMWASYEILFEENFDFVKGGKLPGFCGGKCYTGGNRPNTGDGWSARLMWRSEGAAVQYLYFVDQKSTYGDDAKFDLGGLISQKKFIPGTWHRIVTQVKLNEVTVEGNGEKNGVIRTWFDGELVLNLDTLRLRDYAVQTIDYFYFSTFHGGSDSSWSPTIDSYVQFDNFVISLDSISVMNVDSSKTGIPAKNRRRSSQGISDDQSTPFRKVDGSCYFRKHHKNVITPLY